jgi:hypothetical protein
MFDLTKPRAVSRTYFNIKTQESSSVSTSDQSTGFKDGVLTSIYGPRYRLILVAQDNFRNC